MTVAKARDQFPIGMRVLAVDDDPTCLKLLEGLLLNCQYDVTTTDRASMALKLLRENKGYFDLVISDVHMPDMDGFKLLELLGLEMDLPVIMLSANGQTETVLKGINHGACDYLVKPVRIQELKNIWQHVIRRKKSDAQDESNSDGEDNSKAQTANSEGGQQTANSEGGQLPATSEASDPNERFNRKRKEQNEEYEDDSEETTLEDGSNQKKQRVVWSIELHRKFVDAVNRLGIDRAVPKKILDAMNVEKLTRENVASHLQKYRLYLRRITANHQASMAAALRARHHSYHPIGQLEGFRNAHPLGGPRQLPNIASFRPNGVFGRMDISTGFRQQGITPSRAAQHGHVPNTSYSMNDGVLGKANVNYLQGMPMSLDIDRLQQCNTVKEERNPYAGSFYGNGLNIGSSSNSIPNAMNNPLVLPTSQQLKPFGTLGCHSSLRFPSLSSDPSKLGLGDTSRFPDLGEHNNTWRGAVPSKDYSANISPTSVLTSCNDNIRGNGNPNISHMDSNLHEGSSSNVAITTLCDSGIESCIQSQSSSVGGNTDTNLMAKRAYENSKFLSNSEPNWNDLNQNLSHNSDLLFAVPPSLSNLHLKDTVAENPVLNNGVLDKEMEINASLAQDCSTDHQPNYGQVRPAENTTLNDGFSSNNCSFPDLGNDDLSFFGSDMINDFLSEGTCM